MNIVLSTSGTLADTTSRLRPPLAKPGVLHAAQLDWLLHAYIAWYTLQAWLESTSSALLTELSTKQQDFGADGES